MKNRKQIFNKGALIVVLLFLTIPIFFRPILNFVVDYLWFESVNYFEVFMIRIMTKIKIFLPTLLIFAGLLYAYLYNISNNYKRYFPEDFNSNIAKRFKLKIGLLSAFVGIIFSYNFTNYIWDKFLLFMNAESFNQTDPIFNLDLSFYVFKLPLIRAFLTMIIFVLFWVIIFTVFYFLIVYKKKKTNKEKVVDFGEYQSKPDLKQIFCSHSYKSLVRTISIFTMVILVLIGINYIMMSFGLLFSSLGVIYGAGYTDVNITLLSYRILSGLSFIGAILVYVGYKKGNVKLAFSGPVAIVGLHVASILVAFAFQQLVVSPDEITKETPYIKNNIELTQQGYKINDVTTQEFNANEKLDREAVDNNPEIIRNIRINDNRPLMQTYNELQGIRLYYEFHDIDIDRYTIDDLYRMMFISARELTLERLTPDADTWINRHLKYTHGFGAVMSPVNAVTPEGQPLMFVKDVPPASEYEDLTIKQPRIYFGEKTNDYILINTDEDEFDYPSGRDNEVTRYEGKDGVPLGGVNRLIFSLSESTYKLFVSSNVNSDSRILIRRNIHQRLREIAPFFEYDDNPYLILNQKDGKLYWIVDAYTHTNNFPYSTPTNFSGIKTNYLRNSVKVVVDAYEGTVDYYRFDDEDPMLATYEKIFPNLIKPREEMEDGLEAHIKYPQDLFEIQADMYQKYHVDNPQVFYNGEDVWQVANEKYMQNKEPSKMESNYVMFRLPGEEEVEFLLTLPFTPNQRANMNSLFVARNDGKDFGKLYTYQLPKDTIYPGPMLIESRIDQNTDISQQLTLWDQEGSSVLRGNVIIIPVENSFLYVEPIYLQADSENALPELKRVVVVFGDQVVMENNLELALNEIFGTSLESEGGQQEPVTPDQPDQPGVVLDESARELIQQIDSLFQESQNNLDQLRDLINQLSESLNQSQQGETNE